MKIKYLTYILVMCGVLFFIANVQGEVLENFDEQSLVAAWWTSDTVAPFVYTLDFANTEFARSGKCLKVIYDKANDSNTYSSFTASGSYNLKNYDYFSFWVYNDGSELSFRIKFEDANGSIWESSWANIEPQTETLNADWENLVVDLTRTFSSNIDTTSIKQIVFMIQPQDATASGTFWLDDIKVERAPYSAPLDIFGSDFHGWSSGALFNLELSSEDFLNESIGNCCLRISWGPKGTDYSNFTYEPKHDSLNAPLSRIGYYPDFTLDNNHILELWVKSLTDNNIPILLELDSQDVSTQYYSAGGNWQKLSWDYSAVSSANNVSKVFFIVYHGLADNGGTLFIDDLNLTGGAAPQVPEAPTGFTSDATTPDGDGIYTLSWNAVSGASGYHIQEAQSQNFSGAIDYYTSDIYLNITKDPQTQAGIYYYRMRSKIQENGSDNYGSFTNPIAIEVVATPSGAKNNSYSTTCAEYDNINVPIYKKGITAYRITATHPAYAENMAQMPIWTIGVDDGQAAEFKQSDFDNGDEYYSEDNPASGTDEPSTECPKEINNDWMNYQYLKFTTEDGTETNIGAQFTLDFADISGTLEIEVFTWNGTAWTTHGSKIFDVFDKQQIWEFPDGTFISGTDANNIYLDVITASEGGQSTPGAWAQYDQMKLICRNLAPDTIFDLYHEPGDVDVAGVIMDGWWLYPETMTINVVGGDTLTGAHYLQLYHKVPGIEGEYKQQFFVLYEDGYARILPLPREGEDWIPFGSSVIIGPASEAERPFVDIDEVTIDPQDLSMDITYGDGATAHLEFFSDRTQSIIDVNNITYNTTDYPFATLRSMWVKDGNSDADNIRTQDGKFPIMGEWETLDGNWWFFNRRVPSYHNTLSPDIKIEAIEPSSAFLTIQAEALSSGSGYEIVDSSQAIGGQAVSFSSEGGEAIYNFNIEQNQRNSYLLLKYADASEGNKISVYVDEVLKAKLNSTSTGNQDSFELLSCVYLGDLIVGSHQLKIATSAGLDGLYLDQLEFMAYEIPRSVPTSILARQAETADFGSGYEIGYRDNAIGGQTIIISSEGGEAFYNIELLRDYQNCFIRIWYSDDVGPNEIKIYVDGVFKGKFPSQGTGGWNSFLNSAEIYLGNLTTGNHYIRIVAGGGTYGVDLDQFELFFYSSSKCTVKYINPYYYDSNGIPVWYIGTTMHYELHIKNLSSQNLSSLDIQSIQEYHESGADYDKGDPLPGDSSNTWYTKDILAKATLVLDDDYYYIPYETHPGYDQTHLIISQSGFELYNDPEAGIWCPPSPEGSISGAINIVGRNNHSAQIIFELRDPQDDSLISTYQAISDSSGNYIISPVNPGTYNLVAKTLNTLKSQQTNIVVEDRTETEGVNFTLLSGDADGDNKINYKDRSILRKAYGSIKGSSGWDGRVDFNADNKVNYKDRNILRKNYGQIGD